MADTEGMLEALKDRGLWVTSHVLCTLQSLKEKGLIQGGVNIAPELPVLVEQAQEKYKHSDPTDQEVNQMMVSIQSYLDDGLNDREY